MKTVTYDPTPGQMIQNAVTEAIKLATKGRCVVSMKFNDVELTMTSSDLLSAIVAEYKRICHERSETYRKSPAGKQAAREAEAARQRASAAEKDGILPFNVVDQSRWDSWVKSNTDGYGACVVRYAARWANLMDQLLATGCRLKDIADRASHEADMEGITGFMYGCAVQMLAKCWNHGEELRQWHNLKTQIGSEGKRANESGGVLNPALLNIEPK